MISFRGQASWAKKTSPGGQSNITSVPPDQKSKQSWGADLPPQTLASTRINFYFLQNLTSMVKLQILLHITEILKCSFTTHLWRISIIFPTWGTCFMFRTMKGRRTEVGTDIGKKKSAVSSLNRRLCKSLKFYCKI